jgi:hypothetical protein
MSAAHVDIERPQALRFEKRITMRADITATVERWGLLSQSPRVGWVTRFN